MNTRLFACSAMALLMLPVTVSAQSIAGSDPHPDVHLYAVEDFGIDPEDVTFTKDIAPILQRSCQSCHRAGGGAPMPLTTFQEVRPWARSIKLRTSIRDRMGAMPPFFLEKDIGILRFKNDTSLSDEELAKIQAWVDNGAPRGDPADMPPPREFAQAGEWTIGKPDLVLRSREMTVPAIGPDRWGDIGLVPTGLTEDRYVKAVEVREINDIASDTASTTVGGRYVFHHMTYTSGVLNEEGTGIVGDTRTRWPIHEVGRNADIFPEKFGTLLQANSALHLGASHLHPNGIQEATAHLEFGFIFHPKGYTPEYGNRARLRLGNGTDIDVMPGRAGQEFHAFTVLQQHTKIVAFEPHLHAPGTRMCIEAIWGSNHFTLNCAGYDHNWVKQYVYEDDAAPLLPKGTILHIIGFLDTTAANKNVADSRNWAGGGRRSVANMFIDLGYSVELTEEQFQSEMAERRAQMKSRNDYDIGCPLCWAPVLTEESTTTEEGAQQ
ncbi:MAG: cytochrome c [Acidobacteria bacterium]|nr:MAG: cytochrome c [Acidobacteriota bacterium]